MSYIEKSTDWFLKRMIFNGIKTLVEKRINLFYSIITLIILITNSTVAVFYSLIDAIVFQFFITIELSVIIAFVLSAVVNLKVISSVIRVILSIGLIFGLTAIFWIFRFTLLNYLYNITPVVIFSGLALIVLNLSILIRNLYNSWYTRLGMIGKSPSHFFFEKIIKLLSIFGIFVFLYPLYQFIISGNLLELIIIIIGLASSVINLITIHKSFKYEFNDVFKSILTNVYLISFIFLFFYYENSIVVIFLDLIIFSVSFLSLIQNIKYWGEGRISRVKIDKKPKPKRELQKEKQVFEYEKEQEIIFDSQDDSIIIVDTPEDREPQVKVEIPIGDRKKEKTNKNSYYLIILTVILGSHLLFLRYFSSYLGLNLFPLLLFQDFSMVNYIICLGSFISVFFIFTLYHLSEKYKKYLTYPPSTRKSFLEFLSLLDKRERTKLLRAISMTIQEIIVESLIDLMESEKGNVVDAIGEGIRRGAKFFRRFFGDTE
ncbi:MAG: hypothetical protein GF329_14705 [Candidatus Lokiarchaeota archaeon]|nr:hypothetical protein [Candidatus Lokiarchaeota archaeon]